MESLPSGAVRDLSCEHRVRVEAWWSHLDGGAQAQLRSLYDERAEDTSFFALDVGGQTEWHDLPIELRGFFAVDRAAERENEMWTEQLREYVDAHEDILFFLEERTFHICRAHPEARRVIRTGVIAPDFACPLRRRDGCPFAGATAREPGKAIVLVPLRRLTPSGTPWRWPGSR